MAGHPKGNTYSYCQARCGCRVRYSDSGTFHHTDAEDKRDGDTPVPYIHAYSNANATVTYPYTDCYPSTTYGNTNVIASSHAFIIEGQHSLRILVG